MNGDVAEVGVFAFEEERHSSLKDWEWPATRSVAVR